MNTDKIYAESIAKEYAPKEFGSTAFCPFPLGNRCFPALLPPLFPCTPCVKVG